MRMMESVVVLIVLLSWVNHVFSFPNRYRWLRLLPILTAVVAVIQLLVEKYRWQMTLVYALIGLLLVSSGIRLLIRPRSSPERTGNRVLKVIGSILGSIVMIVAAALPVLFPQFELPEPAGPYAIGTTSMVLLLGTIEEFGWRGLALPLLQRKVAPFWAGLILELIWAVWHIPAFLIGGTPQSAWAFGPYFLGMIALSLILTPMFNAARGSLLIAYLFHFQVNNPLWPDAQPWDTLFFVLDAVVVVALNRKTLFQKGSGVTEVLMPGV